MSSSNLGNPQQQQINKYLQNSRSYYANSLTHYQQNNFPKASECLWGAIAEALKALSLKVRGIPVNKHWEIGDYMDILVGQLHTKGLTNDLKLAAHGLHTYFYETNLNTVDFRMMYAKAQMFYALLQPLL